MTQLPRFLEDYHERLDALKPEALLASQNEIWMRTVLGAAGVPKTISEVEDGRDILVQIEAIPRDVASQLLGGVEADNCKGVLLHAHMTADGVNPYALGGAVMRYRSRHIIELFHRSTMLDGTTMDLSRRPPVERKVPGFEFAEDETARRVLATMISSAAGISPEDMRDLSINFSPNHPVDSGPSGETE